MVHDTSGIQPDFDTAAALSTSARDAEFSAWVAALPPEERLKYSPLTLREGVDIASSVSIRDIRPTSGFRDDTDFFQSSPWVNSVTGFARAHGISAWAALDAVIVRAAALIPFNVVCDAGSGPSPLNLMLAVVGGSGTGKGRAWRLAQQYLPGVHHEIAALTSGEGLGATYGGRVPDIDPDTGKPSRTSSHFELDTSTQTLYLSEIVGVQASMGRSGSTIEEAVNRAWSGESLGTQNRDKTKRISIPAMGYRMCAYVGVQPAEATLLASSSGSGFTQRFFFADAEDPGVSTVPDFTHQSPEPLALRLPDPPDRALEDAINAGDSYWEKVERIQLPREAKIAVYQVNTIPVRGVAIDPLDSHRMQMTARIAAVLSIIEAGGRPPCMTVSVWAWRAALHIMEHSVAVRDELLDRFKTAQIDAATDIETTRAIAREEAGLSAEGYRVQRAAQTMVRYLRRHGMQATGRQLKNSLPGSLRPADEHGDGESSSLYAEQALGFLQSKGFIWEVGSSPAPRYIDHTWALDADTGLTTPGSEKILISLDDILAAC